MKKIFIILIILIVFLKTSYSQTELFVFSNNSHSSYYDSKPIKKAPKLLWTFEMPYQNCSNVIIADNNLLVNCYDNQIKKGFQYAVDKKAGKQIWSQNIPEQLSTPTIKSKIAYYGSKDNKVLALNINNGFEIWRFVDISGPVCLSPSIGNNQLFFGTHSKEWCIVNSKDGKLIKKDNLQNGVCCFPSMDNENVYFTDWDGKLHKQSVLTLDDSVIYQTTMSSHVAPTIVGNIGLITNDNSTLIAVDLITGKELWNYTTDGKLWRSPSVVNQICIIETDNSHIYAFDFNNGKLLWDIKKQGAVYTSATILGNVAYIGCGDKKLYALEVDTGNEIWSLDCQEIVGQVFIENEILYFTAGKNVYAYK